jgi:hypothetical protein
VKVVVFLFYASFELGAFALAVVRCSWPTWPAITASKPPNPKLEPASREINSGIQGEGWSWRGTSTLGI